MYGGHVQRIVTAADTQEAGGLLEGLWPDAGHLGDLGAPQPDAFDTFVPLRFDDDVMVVDDYAQAAFMEIRTRMRLHERKKPYP